MNPLRNYACHRLYDGNRYVSQSTITLDEEGRVVAYRPLAEETAATEWLGGIIVLSPLKSLTEEVREFSRLLPLLTTDGRPPFYAWHLSAFDFKNENLTPQSVLRRLH